MHLSQYIDKFLLKLCYNSMKPSQSESSFLKGKCNRTSLNAVNISEVTAHLV